MTEAPKVYCIQEDKKVPIWYCLGSYMQRRKPCPELLTAVVDMKNDGTKVECTGKKKDDQKTNDKPVPR